MWPADDSATDGTPFLPLSPALETTWLSPRKIKRRVVGIVLVLLAANATVLILLLVLSIRYPHLVSPGVLALSFGLRHAVDADHIAAIDNVTRRLIQEGRQPLLVGLYFSLGHSSIVCLMSMATVLGSQWLQQNLDSEGSSFGKMVATAVSATLLLGIGIANGLMACSSAASSGDIDAHPHGHQHDNGGLIARCCPVLFRFVDREWKMLLVGFLFGLGFETSSEVALLALSAMSPSEGIPPVATLVLPLLFAGAMSLIDTLDGLMMYWAYGFAVAKPGSRRFYNLYLTAVSSVVAIGVGSVEVLGCVQRYADLDGPFWDAITLINDNFEYVGYSIIGFFGLSALGAILAVRCRQPKPGPIQIRPKPTLPVTPSGSAESLKASPKQNLPKTNSLIWWGTRHWGKPEWPWR